MQNPSKKLGWKQILGIGGGLIGLSLALFLIISFIPSSKPATTQPPVELALSIPSTSTSIPTIQFTATITPIELVEETIEPIIPTEDITQITDSPLPSEAPNPIFTKTNEKDGAVLVHIQSGEFLMGSEPEWDPYYWGAEGPAHKVYLDSYWIYQTEVTNAQYEACVTDRSCPTPAFNKSETVDDYYGNPKYSDYPVVFVSYSHAVSYCNWAGGKLPSEAQWEKAARGPGDGLFPWGNDLPNENFTNYCDVNCSESYRDKQNDDGYRDTAPVGNFPDGASFYGVYDMSGNVWEWVFDYFNAGYYQSSAYDNPRGPASSNTRVIRGGSYMNEETGLRVVARYYQNPTRTQSFLGFRCVINDD